MADAAAITAVTVGTGQAVDATWQVPLRARVGGRCRWLRRQLRWLAVSLPHRALSVALRLLRLPDLTVDMYVMVDGDDAATAQIARWLLANDQTAIAVWSPTGRGGSWVVPTRTTRSRSSMPDGYDGEFSVHAVVAVGVTVAARDADTDRLGYLYAELYLPEFGRHDYCADAAVASRRPGTRRRGSRLVGLNRS